TDVKTSSVAGFSTSITSVVDGSTHSPSIYNLSYFINKDLLKSLYYIEYPFLKEVKHSIYYSILQSLLRSFSYSPHLRSEEHTSELQSRFDLVCRLLLEKKKIKYNEYIIIK